MPPRLTSIFVDQQNPPIIRVKGCIKRQHPICLQLSSIVCFKSFKSIVYFFHLFVKLTGPIALLPESLYLPTIPPIWNNVITSPPFSPLAQNVSLVAALKS